jgi:predicted translin family RNA/ssDNA-binding protein
MIDKIFFQNLKKDYEKQISERGQIIGLSQAILHSSKRAIFALHKNDVKKSKMLLDKIEKNLLKLEKKFGYNRLIQEGSYKAGAEEYVEAKMFYKIIAKQKINKVSGIKLNLESYLGGMCDLTGELSRRAVNMAAEGRIKEVEKIKAEINSIMAELVKFDMTGYLRTKYDQAKNSLKKIEQISYEIKIRK